jgi:triosephosphate isomerase
MNRERLIVGNWKLNGGLAKNAALLEGLLAGVKAALPAHSAGNDVGMAVCVPTPYLPSVSAQLSGSLIAWGAQNVSVYESGAYTGEVSAGMLAEFGAQYVIVGHSERRSLFGDTDQDVATRFMRVQAAGMRPILCVGETLAERDAGETTQVVLRQLGAVVDAVGAASFRDAVLAYEPVWAIGTGRTATAAQAEEVHFALRRAVAEKDEEIAARLPILYGGSVKAANAGALFAEANIDGGLVGGASLDAQEFLGIWRAAKVLAADKRNV